MARLTVDSQARNRGIRDRKRVEVLHLKMKLQKDRIQQLSDLAGCPMNEGEPALSLACVDVQDMKHDIATTKAATVIQARGSYHLPHTIDNATLHNNTERSIPCASSCSVLFTEQDDDHGVKQGGA